MILEDLLECSKAMDGWRDGWMDGWGDGYGVPSLGIFSMFVQHLRFLENIFSQSQPLHFLYIGVCMVNVKEEHQREERRGDRKDNRIMLCYVVLKNVMLCYVMLG